MERLVFIPHYPMRFDPILGKQVAAVNLAPAEHWGRLHVCLDPTEPIRSDNVQAKIEHLRKQLEDNIEPEDFLVCIGDPVLIGVAIAHAVTLNGSVNLLRWDKWGKRYELVRFSNDD